MSATSTTRHRRRSRMVSPREDDPRVVRSRAAVVEAATTLFLEKGYAGTTMEDIAAVAGLTKRTVYNNYTEKAALFTQIMADAIAYAEEFASGLPAHFAAGLTAVALPAALHDLGRTLALGILRPEVIALRRLLIGEARAFPELAAEYFTRAPGRVIAALASGFDHLSGQGLLQVPDAKRAAEQFAYLVVGEPLDRAILVGRMPSNAHVIACARDGVETFLARYGVAAGGRRRQKG
jgi:TetR/AcrR family transcriptional regulator, mexJK operon transcriptional repressor